MRTLTAKYNGKCAGCQKPIKRGESIGYQDKKAYCLKCADSTPDTQARHPDFINIDLLYEDQCARACGL